MATPFLPLGFATGLLGVNAAGIPGAEFPGSFVVLCLFLVLLTLRQRWFFKRRGWA